MLVASLVASLLTVVLAGQSLARSADDEDELHRQKDRLVSRIGARRLDLDEISTRLLRASSRVETSVSRLDAARAELADLRDQVQQARTSDRRMREALAQAVDRLADARHDLAEGRTEVEEQRQAVTDFAVTSYQSGEADDFDLDIAFQSASPQEVLDSMQAQATVVDNETAALQELEAKEVLLRLTEQRVADTRAEVATKRIQAAQTLAAKQGLEQSAEGAAQRVADRVRDLRESKREIRAAKRRERQRLETLRVERERVETRLRKIAERRERRAEREARQEARREQRQAERQAQRQTEREAERAAARAARREQRQRQAERADEREARVASAARAGAAGGEQPAPPAQSSQPVSGGVLDYPVQSTYVTSEYGMRMHPILKVYKLHDGTDFGAGCGTPVYASASGRVISAYFNTGYGNRIIIDHGYMEGVSLSTSYNHLTSFVASSGQQVSRGELIGYVGTTGYSTGCHLHFMVYENGATVDPAGWL